MFDSTPDGQMINGLNCRNAEPTVLSNRAVASDNATMNQVHW
jgi:hypothetical protein